jgi:hypothetical protein
VLALADHSGCADLGGSTTYCISDIDVESGVVYSKRALAFLVFIFRTT